MNVTESQNISSVAPSSPADSVVGAEVASVGAVGSQQSKHRLCPYVVANSQQRADSPRHATLLIYRVRIAFEKRGPELFCAANPSQALS